MRYRINPALLTFLVFGMLSQTPETLAQISFVAATSASVSSGTSLTINVPTGTVNPNVMVASIAVRGPSTSTITAPAGWTFVRTDTTTTGITENLATYWKVAENEPASYTWTFSGSTTGAVGGILTFSGVDNGSVIDVSGGQTVTGTANQSAFNVAAPSITTTADNTMLVTAHAVASSGTSGSAWTPPTGMTEAVDRSSGSGTGGESIEMNHVVKASAGATGIKTATVAGHDGSEGVAQIIALRQTTQGWYNSSWAVPEEDHHRRHQGQQRATHRFPRPHQPLL